MAARLSVNVNKVAWLRNARGPSAEPDLLHFVRAALAAGAQGITVHPRPDQRHITRRDVLDLAQLLKDEYPQEADIEFNIEGYPSDEFLTLIAQVRPHQVTLVPDAPHVLTSTEGWALPARQQELQPVVSHLRALGVRVSLFTDTQPRTLQAVPATGAHRVELYTGPYAHQHGADPAAAVAPYAQAAALAHQLGLGVNAGHDLNLHNLRHLAQHLPHLHEVSIGHALIKDCLYLGLPETIKRYRACLGI